MSDSANGDRSRRRALLALALLVPAPTVGVLAGLWWWPQTTLGQTVYTAAKVWLLALPLWWHWGVERRPVRVSKPERAGLLTGIATGVAISAVIVAAYALIGRTWIDAEAVRRAAGERGFDNAGLYVGFAIYISLVNALLEEYVWRWFVFRRCERLVRPAAAALLAAALFTVHHVFALTVYFDWRITALCAAGVFVGGATWSWLYLRYRNVWSPWISHAIVDVAVFWVGWRLIFG